MHLVRRECGDSKNNVTIALSEIFTSPSVAVQRAFFCCLRNSNNKNNLSNSQEENNSFCKSVKIGRQTKIWWSRKTPVSKASFSKIKVTRLSGSKEKLTMSSNSGAANGSAAAAATSSSASNVSNATNMTGTLNNSGTTSNIVGCSGSNSMNTTGNIASTTSSNNNKNNDSSCSSSNTEDYNEIEDRRRRIKNRSR